MAIEGHAIVEQYDATTVVLPGHRAVVDPYATSSSARRAA